MINIFDISTLVTDRTQADVQAWNEKGTYNPSDLNRVTHAMEYLVERIRSYGYAVKYDRVKVPHQPQKGKSRLPAGYTELEYIESTGTQYINTGFVANQDTRVVMEAEHTVTNAVSWLFGARTATGKNHYNFLAYQNKYRTDYNTAILYYDAAITKMSKVDKNKNVTTFNGTEILTNTYATFDCQYPLFLLAMNTAGTASGFASAKVKIMKIYDNGAIVRNYVPCVDPSGAIGLYDMVNGIFYSNAGTGVFTAGAEVELPPVEILDDYTWYHSDIPQTNELNAYLQNVRWLREAMALLPNTPEVPDDMEGFTFTEANNIEKILVNIEAIINLMLSSIIYSGEIFSGEVI